MDEPTKKGPIISGETDIPARREQTLLSSPSIVVPAMKAITQVIPVVVSPAPDTVKMIDISKDIQPGGGEVTSPAGSNPPRLTLEDLMNRGNFFPEQKALCGAMCDRYLQSQTDLGKCLEFMKYAAENDSSKEIFPNLAPHLPAIFSLPAQEQEATVKTLKENVEGGKIFSVYKCVLEVHEEVLRERLYFGLNQLGLNHNDRNNLSIWSDLNSAFTCHHFLQARQTEELDETQGWEQKLGFLEQAVQHYLEMVGSISSRFAKEKPIEARIIARRVALEYGSFHDESTIEDIFESVGDYVSGGLESAAGSMEKGLEYFGLSKEKHPVEVRGEMLSELQGASTSKDLPLPAIPARVKNLSLIQKVIIAGTGSCIVVGLAIGYGLTRLSDQGERKNEMKSLTDEIRDYKSLVRRLLGEKREYQDLAESYETKIAAGELVSVEDIPANETQIEYVTRVVEVPGLVFSYFTLEETEGLLLDLEDYALELDDIKREIEVLKELSDSAKLQNRMLDESNRELQEEKEELAKKVGFYETKDLCLQFRRLVEKKDKKGANDFGMRFAKNYFGGCRTLSLEEFADSLCYMYQKGKDYSQTKKDLTKSLADTFGFDPAKPIRLCPKN